MFASKEKVVDPRLALQGFLVLDAFVRSLLWAGALALTVVVFTALDAWPSFPIRQTRLPQAWTLVSKAMNLVGLYNIFYLALLLLLRLPIPRPREGRYSLRPGKPVDRQLVWSCLIATLTKARYEAPFPAFLVFHVSNLPPFSWIMAAVFGPKSRSCYVTDPIFLDPFAIEVGRNVVFGYGAIISGHTQGRNEIIIQKTIIEDDVLIGGNVVIYGGCTIKRGAVVLGSALVRPGTLIGENEVWGGIPAKKIKTLPPYGSKLNDQEDLAA